MLRVCELMGCNATFVLALQEGAEHHTNYSTGLTRKEGRYKLTIEACEKLSKTK